MENKTYITAKEFYQNEIDNINRGFEDIKKVFIDKPLLKSIQFTNSTFYDDGQVLNQIGNIIVNSNFEKRIVDYNAFLYSDTKEDIKYLNLIEFIESIGFKPKELYDFIDDEILNFVFTYLEYEEIEYLFTREDFGL